MSVIFQLFCTLIVGGLTMSSGLIFAWPSSTSVLFLSENTTLRRPMTSGEIALLGSLCSAGALVGTPIMAFLIDRIGRKRCCIICALVNTIGWSMIALTTYVEVVLVATFVIGLGGAAFVVTSVFIVEFCQESIRGAVSAGATVLFYVGLVCSYLTGGLLSYWHNVYVSLALTILNLCFISILKESPLFLLMKGFENEAIKSIAFYRQIKPSSKEILEELGKLRRIIDASAFDSTPEEVKLKSESNQKKLSVWQFFKKSRSTRRGLFICLSLTTASIFEGLSAIQVYAQPLFESATTFISPTTASVIFACTNIVSGFLAAYLSDKAGRKPLLIYSSIAAGLCSFLCGLQMHIEFGPGWLIPLFIYMYTVFYAFGAVTVCIVLVAEIFLPEVKSCMAMLVLQMNWLCNFLTLLIFERLKNAIGLGPLFYLFAVVCVSSSVFGIFYVPETKGIPLEEIQRLLAPRKRRMIV